MDDTRCPFCGELVDECWTITCDEVGRRRREAGEGNTWPLEAWATGMGRKLTLRTAGKKKTVWFDLEEP